MNTVVATEGSCPSFGPTIHIRDDAGRTLYYGVIRADNMKMCETIYGGRIPKDVLDDAERFARRRR